MDIIFSEPEFDENTFERREPMRTYMMNTVARDLFEKLEEFLK